MRVDKVGIFGCDLNSKTQLVKLEHFARFRINVINYALFVVLQQSLALLRKQMAEKITTDKAKVIDMFIFIHKVLGIELPIDKDVLSKQLGL